MRPRFRSNRFFLVSLANHDATFMPEKKPNPLRKLAIAAFFAPAALVLAIPSLDIGTTVMQAPSLPVPDTIVAGEVFSLPDPGDVLQIQMGSRALARLYRPQSAFVGVLETSPSASTSTSTPSSISASTSVIDLHIIYPAPHRKLSPKMFLPKFSSPSVPVFSKRIKITTPSATNDGDDAHPPHAVAIGTRPDQNLSSLLDRIDGEPSLACWRAPISPENLAAASAPPRPVRRLKGAPPPKTSFPVAAAGPGEVVFAAEMKNVETGVASRTILVYHGGGFYSRYRNMKDLKVRKGDRINAGQELGSIASLRTAGSGGPFQWDIRWGTSAVASAPFLALSSRLCNPSQTL